MHFGFMRDVSARNSRILVGLDVGSAAVCAVVGELNPGRRIGPGGSTFAGRESVPPVHIIGSGSAPSRGVKKGIVVSMEQTIESIREAVRHAEESTGIEIKSVTVGVTGRHIEFIQSQGVIAVKEKEIGQGEIETAVDAARAVATPFDREILHVIPSEYIVNGQGGIIDPRGMVGIRLEVKAQIITGAASSIQNLIKCCNRAGIEVTDVALQPLATADAVLTADDRDLGAALIDIGGGTTDIALFQDGNMFHFASLAVGGGNFTSDVAIGLRVPYHEAERIKRSHGCTMYSMIDPGEEIELRYEEGKPGRRIPRTHLVEILQPRAEELFGLIKEEITGRGFHKQMNSGVVLTGGAVRMEGIKTMAENILELPVRIGDASVAGADSAVTGDAVSAAGAGLVIREARGVWDGRQAHEGDLLGGIRSKLSGWFARS